MKTESWEELNRALKGKYGKDITAYFRKEEWGDRNDEIVLETQDIDNEYEEDKCWAIFLKPNGTWEIS